MMHHREMFIGGVVIAVMLAGLALLTWCAQPHPNGGTPTWTPAATVIASFTPTPRVGATPARTEPSATPLVFPTVAAQPTATYDPVTHPTLVLPTLVLPTYTQILPTPTPIPTVAPTAIVPPISSGTATKSAGDPASVTPTVPVLAPVTGRPRSTP